jgi:hypothetical protein
VFLLINKVLIRQYIDVIVGVLLTRFELRIRDSKEAYKFWAQKRLINANGTPQNAQMIFGLLCIGVISTDSDYVFNSLTNLTTNNSMLW